MLALSFAVLLLQNSQWSTWPHGKILGQNFGVDSRLRGRNEKVFMG
jgi:hypothetical protein